MIRTQKKRLDGMIVASTLFVAYLVTKAIRHLHSPSQSVVTSYAPGARALHTAATGVGVLAPQKS
jgi:hypothetical protein